MARASSGLHPWLKAFFAALMIVILVAALAVLGGWVYWRRSLPETTGTVALTGLQAPVEVYRDTYGVPSIFAQNRADALRTLGYLHAAERFFAMEMNRRAGQGRLAEVAGADMLPLDKFLRTLDLYRLVQTSYTRYRPEHQALFQAYTDGVNAWLQTHQNRLPVEFALLGIKPEPWQPADSLVWGKLMALRLSMNLRDELQRAALLGKYPAAMVERLYPGYPLNAPVTTQPDFIPPPAPSKPETPPASRKSDATPALQQAMQRLAAIWPFAAPGASNEWVISGARSTTGKPVLANDPHLGLEAPVLWYLARLVTPDEEIKGATVPGLPVVLLGQNSKIAWGFTTTNSDVQDVFIETLDPKDPNRYLVPGAPGVQSAPFVTRREIIKVKGAADVILPVRVTRHGPVISDADTDAKAALHDDKHVLAFAFTGLGDADTTPEALLSLNVAHDWAGFQQALQLFQSPPQNIVYADRAGNIGFTNPGLVPVRKQGDGRYPVDGASGAYDWQGQVPFQEIPRLYNPAGGAIVNGNNAVVGLGLTSYWFGREWETPFRAERMTELLKRPEKLTLEDHAAIQGDTLSLPARQLLPQLLRAVPRADLTGPERTALTLLEGWDDVMRADRPAPLLFEWWLMRLYDQLVRMPFGDDLTSGANALAIQQILARPAGWCDTLLKPKSPDCAPQIAAAFHAMVTELSGRYGADPQTWRWGNEHYAPLENKVLGHVPGFNDLLSLSHPADGGAYTVNRGGNFDQAGKAHPLVKTHGSGYRAIYDLSDPAKSRFMIATGESGHPLDKHYADLLPLWRYNRSITLTGTQAELVRQNSGHQSFVP